MQEPIGLTLNQRDGEAPVPVYQNAQGVETFGTDAPYLMSDGKSLAAPVSVVVSDGPVWLDALGNPFDAVPVKMIPGPSGLIEGPLDLIVDTTGNASIGGTFDLATPHMTLGVVTAYAGDVSGIRATHGGQALTLVRVDYADGLATAVFYGNNLTTESAPLVVSAPGATLGPAIMRMRDDWAIGALQTDWHGGAAVANATGGGWVSTSGMPAPRKLLYARGSKNFNGTNGFNVTADGPTLVPGIRGNVLTGTFADWVSIGQITTGWRNEGTQFIHDIYAASPLMLWFEKFVGPFGAKVTYTAERNFSARLRVVGNDSSNYVTLGPGENVVAYLYADADYDTPDKGISFVVSGNVTIHEVKSIEAPWGLHANIGASAQDARPGWQLQAASSVATAQSLSVFSVYGVV